jgi:hypothetical protein
MQNFCNGFIVSVSWRQNDEVLVYMLQNKLFFFSNLGCFHVSFMVRVVVSNFVFELIFFTTVSGCKNRLANTYKWSNNCSKHLANNF